jgi:hypothetical protein
MTTAPIAHPLHRAGRSRSAFERQWRWLLVGAALSFAVPFVFADALAMPRDLYYGVYFAIVLAFVTTWARGLGRLTDLLKKRLVPAIALAVVSAGALTFMVFKTEDASGHPHGLRFVGTLVWRGVAYGFVDGLLLSTFPVLAVFAAFSGSARMRRVRGKVAVGVLALVVSLAFTAIYHLGYPDFRGAKLRKPLAGDLIWSAPTIVTLNPIASPLAHVALHVSAVIHSYDTETFLPPHAEPRTNPQGESGRAPMARRLHGGTLGTSTGGVR